MTSEELFFDALKAHRESKSIEISEICEFTKINSKYIEAIENGDFSVLPEVYMRLFIRAYSNFIGADSEKALEDFELHSTGKIQKKTTVNIQPAEEPVNIAETGDILSSASQIEPKQIAMGAAVIIGLFVILYWAGEITNQQKNVLEDKPEPAEVIKPAEKANPEPEMTPIENSEDEEAVEKKKKIQ